MASLSYSNVFSCSTTATTATSSNNKDTDKAVLTCAEAPIQTVFNVKLLMKPALKHRKKDPVANKRSLLSSSSSSGQSSHEHIIIIISTLHKPLYYTIIILSLTSNNPSEVLMLLERLGSRQFS